MYDLARETYNQVLTVLGFDVTGEQGEPDPRPDATKVSLRLFLLFGVLNDLLDEAFGPNDGETLTYEGALSAVLRATEDERLALRSKIKSAAPWLKDLEVRP